MPYRCTGQFIHEVVMLQNIYTYVRVQMQYNSVWRIFHGRNVKCSPHTNSPSQSLIIRKRWWSRNWILGGHYTCIIHTSKTLLKYKWIFPVNIWNSKFNVLLTVHHAMILGNCPTWRTNSFQCNYLFIVLYMFRACHAHYQEKQIVSIQLLVIVVIVYQ